MKKRISPKELLMQQQALKVNEPEEKTPIIEQQDSINATPLQQEQNEEDSPIEIDSPTEKKQLSTAKSKSNTRNQMTDAEVKGLFNQGELDLVHENLQEFSERILGKTMSSRSMFLTDEFISTVKRYKDITGEKRSINEFINIFCYYGMSRLYDELKKSKEFKDWINMVK